MHPDRVRCENLRQLRDMYTVLLSQTHSHDYLQLHLHRSARLAVYTPCCRTTDANRYRLHLCGQPQFRLVRHVRPRAITILPVPESRETRENGHHERRADEAHPQFAVRCYHHFQSRYDNQDDKINQVKRDRARDRRDKTNTGCLVQQHKEHHTVRNRPNESFEG